MAISIKDLFTYKKEVVVENREGQKASIWVRLLGEFDLNESYKLSRIASTNKRVVLRNSESTEYADEIFPLAELTREELTSMILGARRNRITAEAFVKVDREELPKIEEIAIEPDAPSLEEQEILDQKSAQQVLDYEEKIDNYTETRLREESSLLVDKTDAEIIKSAQDEMVNILPLQSFFAELSAQKGYRGAYSDKECRQRVFSSVDEFKNADNSLRKQITDAYNALEVGSDDIKN